MKCLKQHVEKDPKNQRKMTFSPVPLSSLPLYSPGSLLVSQVHPSLVYRSLVISIWTIITRQLADIYHHPGPRKHLSRIHFILLIVHRHSLSHQYFIQVIIHIGSSQPALMSPFGEQSNSMGSSAAFNHHSYPYQPFGAPSYHSVISGTRTFLEYFNVPPFVRARSFPK